MEMVVPDAGGETLLHHAAFHGKVRRGGERLHFSNIVSEGSHSGVVT